MNGTDDEPDGDGRVDDEGDGDGRVDDGGDGDDGHGHGEITPLRAAAERVRDLREEWLDRWDVESVSLDRVSGRTLAEPVDAPDDVPARSHATMDGYAFDATEGYPYELVDREVFPESDPSALGDGEAVRIFTGAPLPAGADAVLKQEQATVEDGRLDGSPTEPGTYVYERGSNVAAGERLFAAGERLGAKDAILLGDLGIDEVPVVERLSVGLLATGTEIHEGRHADLDSPMLAGLVRGWGAEATYEGTVPDEYERVRDRIAGLAAGHDVVMTTGGTSVGDKDYVVRALRELGTVRFHRVALRPGKPIAVATLDDRDAVVFAIPGKPVGAHAVTSLVARPFFTGNTALPTVDAAVTSDVGISVPGFTYAVPVTLDGGEATPLGHVDSPLAVYDETFDPSVLSSSTRATRADGFVLTESALSAGEAVDVVPYPVVER
ncbi:molybdopterin molybdenumtransferase MoeA [Halorubrum sp. Ea1]|uniref:molybdopterin molybdotransferase MoeA n=1 Tax=Halorubrum sp. Ea1 TaxID=1480718 RepID=UPI000B99A895|nr:molybdopterin molybdotransferase MoeA [Halorubrum sp. Ea1]OYR53389.1 molybdopterin molybdenumtransferase MoeA [Halorubrum sp. Ea1]